MHIEAPWLATDASRDLAALLQGAGHQLWFVGGCVRNALMGAPVADLDVATDAHPSVVMALARDAGFRAIPTGIDHGTVTVVVGDTPFEITTFRKDVATDGRRAVVAFSDDIADDARRRDFTMNALYLSPDGALVDPVGGLPDLQARLVRFIEDPSARVREDYLRILRFFRFHAWYGDVSSGLDADGLAACAAGVERLATLSAERVGQEMRKLLTAADPAPAVAAMAQCGALAQVLPGALSTSLAVLVHLEQLQEMSPDPIRRLAALGGDVERLRLTKKESARLSLLRDYDGDPRKTAYRHGAGVAVDSVLVFAASLGQPFAPNDLRVIDRAVQQVFPLKAADLAEQFHGPALGAALRKAEARWIASDFTLTKDQLLD